ncbi:hypothetical protein V8V88_12380 [Paenibacillus phytohabitans]
MLIRATIAGIKGTFALHLLIRATIAGIKGTFTLHLLIRATIAGIKGIYTTNLFISGDFARIRGIYPSNLLISADLAQIKGIYPSNLPHNSQLWSFQPHTRESAHFNVINTSTYSTYSSISLIIRPFSRWSIQSSIQICRPSSINPPIRLEQIHLHDSIGNLSQLLPQLMSLQTQFRSSLND